MYYPEINCKLTFCERTNTVVIRAGKYNCQIMQIKLECSGSSTMSRALDNISEGDADNHWIAIKPSDSTVYDEKLYSKKQVIVKQLDFDLI